MSFEIFFFDLCVFFGIKQTNNFYVTHAHNYVVFCFYSLKFCLQR